MQNDLEYPKIRIVEPIPINVKEQTLIGLRDPHDLNNKGQLILMNPESYLITNFFNGKNSITDIQNLFFKSTKMVFPRREIESIIKLLDENIFLDNDKYEKAVDEFKKKKVRESALAGKSIPNDKKSLENLLKDIKKLAKAPAKSNRAKAIISPHIDIIRGKHGFAEAYNALKNNKKDEIFVILGTSHYADFEKRFIATKKQFETPLGKTSVNEDFINKLQEKCDYDLCEHEIFHKGEHSIEFQVIFLQSLFGPDISIVPLLVSSFDDLIMEGTYPNEDAKINSTLNALMEITKESKKDICFIAGVDLSHIGIKFGSKIPPDKNLLSETKFLDLLSLDHAIKVDSDGFFKVIMEFKNKYNNCGVSSIYTMLYLLEESEAKGNLLYYEQSPEKQTESNVSFASVAFY